MSKTPTPETTPDDKQLIQETLAGNSAAFGQLVQKHQTTLIDLAFRMLRVREEAEDVVQHVFVDAYRHLADFRHGSQFSTWLYSITLNRVRNHLRSRKIRQSIPLETTTPGTGEPRTLQIADTSPAADTLLEKRLDLEWIQKEVQTLHADYQDIFMLHYFQNMSLQEVAKRVKRPLGTVKVYLHRARKELYQRRLNMKVESDT